MDERSLMQTATKDDRPSKVMAADRAADVRFAHVLAVVCQSECASMLARDVQLRLGDVGLADRSKRIPVTRRLARICGRGRKRYYPAFRPSRLLSPGSPRRSIACGFGK